MKGKTVWVAGCIIGESMFFNMESHWALIGVFTSRALAISACNKNEMCFVAPRLLGSAEPKGTVEEWPDVEFIPEINNVVQE